MPDTTESQTQQPATNQPSAAQSPGGTAAPAPGETASATQASPGRTSGLPQGAGEQGQAGVARRRRGAPWDMIPGANPFSMMRQFADEMDRLFESFGFPSFGRQWPGRSMLSNLEQQDVQGAPGQAALTRPQGGGGFWAPQIDVSRRGDELVVCADLPGMSKDDIHVEVQDDQLILQGERRWEQEQGGENEGFYRSERSYGRFFRAVPLPEGVDPGQVQAGFTDGVLEVKMPLPPEREQRGRKIEIR